MSAIIDTHVHLWDPNVFDYGWHRAYPEFQRPHVFEALDEARGSIEIEKLVFLECLSDPPKFLDELAWVSSLAEKDERLAAMVPYAAVEKGDAVRADLEKIAQVPMVRGVRQVTQAQRDDRFVCRADFIEGVRCVSDFDLHFELCIKHPQLAAAIELVRACPTGRFVLDHIGKPNIKDHVREPWCTEMKELAACENVWCKVSGMATEADHNHWTTEDLRPYIEHVIECFGFDRVMFGSDWPVATWATAYPRWVETLREVVQSASDVEREKLFRLNAIHFYRIEV